MTTEPIRMLLWCPECNFRHIDAGEFADKPHHTHACHQCGMVWRPAVEDTVGVEFLYTDPDELGDETATVPWSYVRQRVAAERKEERERCLQLFVDYAYRQYGLGQMLEQLYSGWHRLLNDPQARPTTPAEVFSKLKKAVLAQS